MAAREKEWAQHASRSPEPGTGGRARALPATPSLRSPPPPVPPPPPHLHSARRAPGGGSGCGGGGGASGGGGAAAAAGTAGAAGLRAAKTCRQPAGEDRHRPGGARGGRAGPGRAVGRTEAEAAAGRPRSEGSLRRLRGARLRGYSLGPPPREELGAGLRLLAEAAASAPAAFRFFLAHTLPTFQALRPGEERRRPPREQRMEINNKSLPRQSSDGRAV
ncbi:uncharacterized protein LOC141547300 [Sminthopsis crassicaudata]|uniref:uncharacterized protein LOC141547300 n=1 Tax=Sminthopsis crassicaudata TaxID=9301 RepID=UPI003D695D68